MVAIVALSVLLLEGFFRAAYPTPPVQVIRMRGTQHRVVRGVPVWEDADSAARLNHACTERWPEAERVVWSGSSITFGTGVEGLEAFPARIQAALDAQLGEGRVCVQNLAQPGFSFLNKLVVLEDFAARATPRLVVWEVWANDLYDHTLIGGSAYSLRDLATDAAGYPVGPLANERLHHIFFEASRAYEYTSLVVAAGARSHTTVPLDRFERIARVAELCRRVGATLVLLFAPSLDRPFDQQRGHGGLDHLMYTQRWAATEGVAVVPIADLLVAEDYRTLRLDPCCHYNARGHARLADALLEHPVLGPLLLAAPADEAPTP